MEHKLFVIIFLVTIFECNGHLPILGEILNTAQDQIKSGVEGVAGTVLGGLNLNLFGSVGQNQPQDMPQKGSEETIIVVVAESDRSDYGNTNNYGPPHHGPPHHGPPHHGPPHHGPPHHGPPHYGPPHYGPPHYGPPHHGPPHHGPQPDAPPYDGPPHEGPPHRGPPHHGPPHHGPPHHGPPHHGPPHHGPPHHGPPHHGPPHDGPPHYGPPPPPPPHYQPRPHNGQNQGPYHNNEYGNNDNSAGNQNSDNFYGNNQNSHIYDNNNGNSGINEYQPTTKSTDQLYNNPTMDYTKPLAPTTTKPLPKVTDSNNETEKKADDKPLFIPLNSDEYVYGGDKINLTEPKRDTDKTKQQEEDDDFSIDIRLKDE